MVNERTLRALLYGGALLTISGLCTAYALYRPAPDVYTLLSSADVQLRMAYAIPEKDGAGKPIDSRATMIADAERSLAMVEKRAPGMAVTAEFRGFVHMLKGEPKQAAAAYAAARACRDVTAEQRDVLTFNEGRMLAAAGEVDAALTLFGKHAEALDARYGAQRRLEEAGMLREAGRTAEAEKLLDAVVLDKVCDAQARFQAGREYMQLGAHAKARSALREAADDVSIANYYLARLKLAEGDVDTSLALLETAIASAPGDARRLLRQEASEWQGVVADPRFEQLQMPHAATPGR